MTDIPAIPAAIAIRRFGVPYPCFPDLGIGSALAVILSTLIDACSVGYAAGPNAPSYRTGSPDGPDPRW